VGSGKSHVALRLAALAGAEVVDADVLAREALAERAADGTLARTFGSWALKPDGCPDRRALARRAFSDPEARRRLEALIHPPVLARIRDRVRAHRRGEGPALLVLDVPLLIESGLDRCCDVLWFVDASEPVRRARAEARGIPRSEASRREDCQTPIERKRGRADLVLPNDGDPDVAIRAALERMGLATPAPS
jgi:dephospho-CoA kinase